MGNKLFAWCRSPENNSNSPPPEIPSLPSVDVKMKGVVLGPPKSGKNFFIKQACPKYDGTPATNKEVSIVHQRYQAEVSLTDFHQPVGIMTQG